MTHQQRVALARVMADLIKSDEIIDVSEMEFFISIRDRYRIEAEHLIAAQQIDFGMAVEALQGLPNDELASLMSHLREMTLADGNCVAEEAFLLMALEYCLSPKRAGRARLLSTSVTNICIEKRNIVYTETEYDADTNRALQSALRTLGSEFKLAGLQFVYMPQLSQDFCDMESDYLTQTIELLAPSVSPSRRDEILQTLRTITTRSFCDNFLVKRMGLEALFDSDPAVLFQVYRSHNRIIYLHLTLGDDVVAELNELVEMYQSLTTATLLPVERRRSGKRFIYRGFHRALFDLLAFPGHKVESRLILDMPKHRLYFPDLGTEVSLPSKQLALYAFILQQSLFSAAHELPVEPSSDKRRQSLEHTFRRIYGMVSDSPTGDYASNLTPNLAHIKAAIKKLDLLDNPETYIPERKGGVLRLRIRPSKIFVMEQGEPVPMEESVLWPDL
ncbi:MAG: hypothetical protein HUK02_08390 [Bacteroidaceae bacterium]|nr:hypothetical protein [Bacteroidaceae bacterium]